MPAKAPSASPYRIYGASALVATAACVIGLFVWLQASPVFIWLVSINVVTFLFYGFDKMKAQGGGLRVPERILHGLVLVGGSAGGLAGQLIFRHKIRKTSFQITFWVIVVLQIVGACAWLLLRQAQ